MIAPQDLCQNPELVNKTTKGAVGDKYRASAHVTERFVAGQA